MIAHPQTHIIILCSGLNVAGGLEKMVVALANALVERNYTIRLLVLSSDKNSFFPINDNINVDNMEADFGIGGTATYLQRKAHFLKDISSLRKKIIALQPDIVIATEYTQTAALITGQLHKKYKIISWQHSSYYQPKSTLWKRLSDYAYKKVQAIVCLNEDERNIYIRFNKNAIIIPNFIDTNTRKNQLNTNTLLTIARLVNNKGIDLLMETAKIILPKYPTWTWKIIGEGLLAESLCEYINKNSLQTRLIYQQPKTFTLNTEYEQSAIYVLTSRVEPFGMVLLEAMSHSLPCIAFDCDTGPRHIITDNVDGILVEKENPEKLAEAISLLIKDKEKRSRMGKAAFENVKRFSSEIILKKWEALFKELLLTIGPSSS